MTNLTRKIATTATAVVIAAGLVAGFATPALAATTGLPIPGPVRPGPSVPPLPPGYTPRLAVQFPACSSQLLPNTLTRVDAVLGAKSPTTVTANSGSEGTQEPALLAVIHRNRNLTCSYAGDAHFFVTEVAISSADYSQLEAWYYANGRSTGNGGTMLPDGRMSQQYFQVGDNLPGTWMEYAVISRDGWWITYWGLGAPATIVTLDARTRFLQVNFTRV